MKDNNSLKIKSEDAWVRIIPALSGFIASTMFALLCHMTTGFLSFFFGFWTVTMTVMALISTVVWFDFVFSDH